MTMAIDIDIAIAIATSTFRIRLQRESQKPKCLHLFIFCKKKLVFFKKKKGAQLQHKRIEKKVRSLERRVPRIHIYIYWKLNGIHPNEL